MLKFILLVTYLLLSPSFMQTTRAESSVLDHKTVALAIGTDASNINVPSVELYRKVKNYLDLSDYWVRSPSWTTKKALGRLEGSKIPHFGSIPFFDRSFLKLSLKAKKSQSTLITPVQIMLDTLALEGAILVDCDPIGDDAVKKCGLYYYDRASRKVVASAEKEFVAGVKDASGWAATLTSSLAEGMNHVRGKREKIAVNSILEATKDEKDSPMNWLIELQIQGGKASSFDHVKGTLPSAELILGMTGENFGFGLSAYFTQNKEKLGTNKPLFKETSGQFLFQSKADAGETLTWDFHIGTGYSERTLVLGGGDSLKTQDVKMSIGPGLLWNMSKSASFGLVGKYDRYMEIESKNKLSNADLRMFEEDFRIGVRLQTRF